MSSPSFKVKYAAHDPLGYNDYYMYQDGLQVGMITFKVVDRVLHIYNVYVHPQYREDVEFYSWAQSFPEIVAHRVVPEAIDYWERLGAEIYSYVDEVEFEDIVFEKDELC
jgi:hypothetical protein